MAGKVRSRPEVHRLQTSPLDWVYLGEGKAHAVFAYSARSCSSVTDYYQGCILRISKNDFAEAYELQRRNNNRSDADDTLEIDIGEAYGNSDYPRAAHTIDFISNVLRPALGKQYIDVPVLTCLSVVFLNKLFQLQQDNIPKSRLLEEGWKLKYEYPMLTNDAPKKVVKERAFLATLHRNYAILDYSSNCLLGDRKSRFSICIEVKPKAGYLSRSPLVKKEHRVKLHRHRYGILQNLMASGHVARGWGGILEVSSYSPLDLFSGDYHHIERALLELFRHPQNNLRLFHNGVVILSNEKTPSDEEFGKLIRDMLSNEVTGTEETVTLPQSGVSSRHAFIQLVVMMLSQVFHSEPLLYNLLLLQQLDLIDGDGAVEVYNRLVELCGGSVEKAEELIDGYSSTEGFRRSEVDLAFQITKPHCSALDSYCSESNKFKSIIENGSFSDVVLDDSYAKAINCVKRLSREGCVWLLEHWLISLCACDVSVMACFERTYSTISQSLSTSLQGVAKSGSLHVNVQDGTSIDFRYSLKVADTDPKPARKLRTRFHKESIFHLVPSGN